MAAWRAGAWGGSLLAHGLAAAVLLQVPAARPPEPPLVMDIMVPAPDPAEVAAAPRLDTVAQAAPPAPSAAAEPEPAQATPPEPPVAEAVPESAPAAPPDIALVDPEPDLPPPPDPPPEPPLAPPPKPPAPPRAVRVPPRPVQAPAAVAPPAAQAAPSAPAAAAVAVGPPPTWLGQVAAALARHHSYPPHLRAQRMAGVVLVRFTLDRTGKLLSRDVARSSGHAELDALALALLGRAAPLPPPPAEMPGAVVELVVPVRYAVR